MLCLDFSAKSDGFFACSLLNYFIKSAECSAAYKENICCVDLYKLLMGMLSSALGRNRSNRTFKNLKKRLLNTLAAYVPCYGNVFRLLGYLIYFIDINDTSFGTLDVIVSSLYKLEKYILNVFTDISGLSKGCSVGNGKGYIKHTCQCLG